MSQTKKFLITGITVFFVTAVISILEFYVLPQFQSFDKSGIYSSYQNRIDFEHSFSAKYSASVFLAIFLAMIVFCFYGLKKSLSVSFSEQLTMGLACAPLAVLGLVGGLGPYSLYSYIAPGVPILTISEIMHGHNDGWNELYFLFFAVLSIPLAVIGLRLNTKILRGAPLDYNMESQETEYYKILGILIVVVLAAVFIVFYS